MILRGSLPRVTILQMRTKFRVSDSDGLVRSRVILQGTMNAQKSNYHAELQVMSIAD